MIVIVCIDNNNGMMFNNRRQSRDSAVVARIKEITAGKRLLMNSYSASLFGEDIVVDENFLEKASDGDYCFIENEAVPDRGIEGIILYKWNRDYPADKYLQTDMNCMTLESEYEFEGFSHEKITEEIFLKNEKFSLAKL